MGWLAAGAGSRGGLGDTPLSVGDVVGCQQHTIRSHLYGAYGGLLYVVEMYQCVIALTLQHYLRGSDSDGHFGQWFEKPVQKPTGSVGSTVGLKTFQTNSTTNTHGAPKRHTRMYSLEYHQDGTACCTSAAIDCLWMCRLVRGIGMLLLGCCALLWRGCRCIARLLHRWWVPTTNNGTFETLGRNMLQVQPPALRTSNQQLVWSFIFMITSTQPALQHVQQQHLH